MDSTLKTTRRCLTKLFRDQSLRSTFRVVWFCLKEAHVRLYLKLFAVGLLAFATVGCHKKVVATHPGAISNLDSYAYDILLVEQDALNDAVAKYKAGQLPMGTKDVLNY